MRASIRRDMGKGGAPFPTTTSITAPSIINDQAIITTKAVFTWNTSSQCRIKYTVHAPPGAGTRPQKAQGSKAARNMR